MFIAAINPGLDVPRFGKSMPGACIMGDTELSCRSFWGVDDATARHHEIVSWAYLRVPICSERWFRALLE